MYRQSSVLPELDYATLHTNISWEWSFHGEEYQDYGLTEIRDCALRCIITNVTEKPAASIIGPACPKTEASSPLVDLVLICQRGFKPLELSDKYYMYSSFDVILTVHRR